MPHPLLKKLDRIENQRTQLLEKIQTLSSEQLQQPPGEGKWSILEIIEHLVLAEDTVLAGMKDPGKFTSKKGSWFRYQLVMGILRGPVKVQVPARAMHPRGKQSLTELIQRWEKSHQLLRAHLEKVITGEISGPVFSHPVSGPITTKQGLNMLEIHIRRHFKQINKIIEIFA